MKKGQKKALAFLATLTPFAMVSSDANAWVLTDITDAFTAGGTAVTAAQGGWMTLLGLMVGITLIARLFKA